MRTTTIALIIFALLVASMVVLPMSAHLLSHTMLLSAEAALGVLAYMVFGFYQDTLDGEAALAQLLLEGDYYEEDDAQKLLDKYDGRFKVEMLDPCNVLVEMRRYQEGALTPFVVHRDACFLPYATLVQWMARRVFERFDADLARSEKEDLLDDLIMTNGTLNDAQAWRVSQWEDSQFMAYQGHEPAAKPEDFDAWTGGTFLVNHEPTTYPDVADERLFHKHGVDSYARNPEDHGHTATVMPITSDSCPACDHPALACACGFLH